MRRNLIITLLIVGAVGTAAFALARLAIAASGSRMFIRVTPQVILPDGKTAAQPR